MAYYQHAIALSVQRQCRHHVSANSSFSWWGAWLCVHADAAIWFTDQALASAKRRHSQLSDRGRMVLPGGGAFAVLRPYVPADKLRIGHFDSLSATRNLVPVIAAMEMLQIQLPASLAELELPPPDDSVGMARLVLPLLASYSDAWRAGGFADNRCASTYTTAQSAAHLLQASTAS